MKKILSMIILAMLMVSCDISFVDDYTDDEVVDVEDVEEPVEEEVVFALGLALPTITPSTELKYDHRAFSYADDTLGLTFAIDYEENGSTYFLLIGFVEPLAEVEMVFVYQVDGVEKNDLSYLLTADISGYIYIDDIPAELFNGVDFYDMSGNGVFDAIDDYPLLSFKEVYVNSNLVFINPDL